MELTFKIMVKITHLQTVGVDVYVLEGALEELV